MDAQNSFMRPDSSYRRSTMDYTVSRFSEEDDSEITEGKVPEEIEEDEAGLADPLMVLTEKFLFRKRHVKRFRQLFHKLDIDGSNTVDKHELLLWLQEPNTAFSDHLFMLVNVQQPEHMKLNEFIEALSTFALFGQDEILQFCFYVFDTNKDGTIDHEELHRLVEMLHEYNGDDACRIGNYREILAKFDKDQNGLIDFDEFKDINQKHPFLLYPAFRLQKKIETCTMGSRWWYRHRQTMLKRQRQALNDQYNEEHQFHREDSLISDRSSMILMPSISKYTKWLFRTFSKSALSLTS